MTSSGLTDVSILMLVAATAAAVTDWWAVASDRKTVEYFAEPAVLVLLVHASMFTNSPFGSRQVDYVEVCHRQL